MNAVGVVPSAKREPLMSVMFSKPSGLFESRKTAATPSAFQKFARSFSSRKIASYGSFSVASPILAGGFCIGRVNARYGSTGCCGDKLVGSV